MKPPIPHDPLDDLIAAALHGELTPEERTQFEARLQNDPAARAAYQEAQLMHTQLEHAYAAAQPDSAFEQRMVSGVRRRIQHQPHDETAWESLLVLWLWLRNIFGLPQLRKYGVIYVVTCAFVGLTVMSVLLSLGSQVKGVFTTISAQLAYASDRGESPSITIYDGLAKSKAALKTGMLPSSVNLPAMTATAGETTLNGVNTYTGGTTVSGGGGLQTQNGLASDALQIEKATGAIEEYKTRTGKIPTFMEFGLETGGRANEKKEAQQSLAQTPGDLKTDASKALGYTETKQKGVTLSGYVDSSYAAQIGGELNLNAIQSPATPAPDTRKLIRNAQLELEVKSFQTALDQITALTKTAGGYIDTSNSQRGGNGKLQGTVVVKVLPQNLDDFLLKLRDLGEVKNQSVGTEDVTKDYYDTQARLDNSRRMETQLQDLLKHENSKVADLLQVERELGRVRGEIEQMQGQLKLYDFQVAYATVTIQMSEKDLNQTAAYLLREQDDFSLFATDVEGTFQQARQAADEFKAQILVAKLNHNSGSDISANLVVSVPPEQIEPFLTAIKALGRVANFTRDTQRVAKDGGDSDNPADQTLTEKDKVMVNISIRSDDESRKQVALTVVVAKVDDALDQAKAAALAQGGAEVLSSALNKTPQGQSTAQLSVRVPGKAYHALLDALRALGRTASFSLQREDNSGPGANGDDAPVIVSLSLTDLDTPLQQTEMSVLASDVDGQSQQIKKQAVEAGVQVTASSFQRQPDGTELAEMTFHLPMSKYPAFVETVKNLGKVESLTVQRQDRPDQTRADDTAPVEIGLRLHNQGDIIADDHGLWATLRETFGEGLGALFGSVKVIGVALAFLTPWVFTLVLLAWIGRRIYLWRKK